MSKPYQLLLITITLLAIIFFGFQIKNFRIDASSDTLVSQNDKDFKYFNYYQNIFPTNNSLIVAIKSKQIIDERLLNEVQIISDKISRLQEVSSIFNINKAPILFLNNTNLIDLSSGNYETIQKTKIKINNVLDEFANSPIYSNQIINDKKNITSLVIFLNTNKKLIDLKKNKEKYISNNTYFKIKSQIDQERQEFIFKIRNILQEGNKDYQYYLGGVEMISNDVISFVKKDILIFSIIVLLTVLIILFIIFKKLKLVLIILSTSIFAVYSMLGLISFLNFEITAVSSNFISLMFILSISMNIHIMNNYLQSDYTIAKTLTVMFWPCFYTFLTTVVAFLSLVISDIKPIIDFGLVMIIALFIILLTAFTILPLLISFFKKENIVIQRTFIINKKFLNYSINYKEIILVFNLSFFFIAVYGITQLNVENSFIKYFKKNTEIYQGMKLIDTELGGTTPLDIIVKFENNEVNIISTNNDENNIAEDETEFEEDIFSNDLFNDSEDVWFTDDKINTVKKIHKYLEGRNEIGKVISIYSLIDLANKINKNDLSPFELSILYNEIPDEYRKDLINPYLNINENMVKISARVKDSENIKRAKLIEDIKRFSNEQIENTSEININGLLVLYNNMLSSLFSSQIKSLGFVIFVIFLMFIFLFKSIKLSIAGIIPNIFASTFILGLIGILNIPLDIMTITIAAISIGIAVDNTIHYLYRYKQNNLKNMDFLNSIEKSHFTVGNAVLTTSIAISLGFLILCFSNFIPTIIFGLFTSLAMLFAMIGVLITLPSILYYIK